MNENANQADPADVSRRRRLRLATLTLVRWGAIGGQAAALLVVHFGFGYPVPLLEAFAVVGASVVVNISLMTFRPAQERLRQGAASGLLAFDLVQLAVLLYLTGGLGNPFAFLLLAPVTVSAMMLNRRSIVVLCALALVAITLLGFWHLPLPWEGEGLTLPPDYILGGWVALAVGIPFFAGVTWKVAVEARRMSHALSASQLALAREQQLTALGGLAAAAAHELGTPLGTIAVVSRELARELPQDSPLADDVELLIEQTGRCRQILAELARGPPAEAASSPSPPELGLDALIEMAALRPRHVPRKTSASMPRRIIPARTCRRLWSSTFPRWCTGSAIWSRTPSSSPAGRSSSPQGGAAIIGALQCPTTVRGSRRACSNGWASPMSPRAKRRGGHMGLGVFIARTLLELTGARLAFSNRESRGAVATVTWPPVPWSVRTAIVVGQEMLA